jgi:catechol 1,2-dioxygenase
MNEMIRKSRREFLRNSTLMAVSLSLPNVFSCKDNPAPIDPDDCLTTSDILGPFYKAGSPLRENIIPEGESLEQLIVEGQVFTTCDTPLLSAVVEIWNANEDGEYDTSDEFKFRGQLNTAADGKYRFITIIPGRYLNGGTFRPSHIHFRVTAPNHQELISQVYFKDDPFIDDDPWAGSPKAVERILTIQHDANGDDTVNFNIYMIPE